MHFLRYAFIPGLIVLCSYLDEMSINRCLDLTLLDYFLLAYLKSEVCVATLGSLEDRKVRIHHDIQQISLDITDNVRNEFIHRLGYCLATNGAQYEHLVYLCFKL